ncbi:MAG: hypothetical protein DRH43_04160 [Deltaproteobacteria bacterium]|nr:MAG: hypothetical protein DRH43_04160 [Deltaproteobacteria bacterium]
MSEPNKTPEQIARDRIDRMLTQAGWSVQDKNQIEFGRAKGIAVREYPTDSGPADYVLFVERKPIGVIEAKRPEMGQNINVVAEQSAKYATANLKWIKDNKPLPLLYESTGEITLFRDERDPKPRSREVFWFHQPQTLTEWTQQSQTLRARLQKLPSLATDGLRKVQVEAITRLEESFKAGRPRALIQMATGAGKTFTAITSIYRLLKYANASRILFLVDTKNLGEQAEQEFMAYLPSDDNRKFTELYNVQRLSSSYIADSSQVVISTIQRLYSILKDEPLDEAAELEHPAEHRLTRKEPLPQITRELLDAVDPDRIDQKARQENNLPSDAEPDEEQRKQAASTLAKQATAVFNGELNEMLENIRRSHEQVIDNQNIDKLVRAEWDGDARENAEELTREFADFLRENKDELLALRIFFEQPFRRREVTFQMLQDVLEKLRTDRPKLAPVRVWEAFAMLDDVKGTSPVSELTALVSLIRRVTGIDGKLTPFSETVNRNFKTWIFRRHQGAGEKFTEEQMSWLRMIRDHIAASHHLERDDLELAPFDANGGLGKMWQLFGEDMDRIIDEMNEVLAA